MKELLNKYHQVKLARYNNKMEGRQAQIAAQYALDDMMNDIRGYKRDCGYTDAQICEVIKMEIEDCETAMAA